MCWCIVAMALVGAGACAKKKPPVARPTPPPPAAGSSTTGNAAADSAGAGAGAGADPGRADRLGSAVRDGHRHHQQELAVPAGVLRARQAEIDAAGQQALNANAELLKKYATWVVTIEGHSDERGTAEYNLALGERRALAARTYLVSLGIPADRLRTVSYGKEFPFDPGHDEGSWSKNRRAHFVVTSK